MQFDELVNLYLERKYPAKAPKGDSFKKDTGEPSRVDSRKSTTDNFVRTHKNPTTTHAKKFGKREEEEYDDAETFETYLKDIFAQQYDSDPEQFENFIDDIHDALGQLKEYDLNRGSGLAEPVELGIEMGLDFDNAVERAQDSLKDITVSDVIKGRGK